ncbi:VOC family protein [Thalassoroseus pseudoceratinae]|uniref:VOC family protein n=1 Tax=Thalassoroseus pseudoceratinae TaxID=2713176 RepID=UPI00141D82E4|nr:VOC family protein [Thalassoroseus pseudoceratinae]
MATPMPKLNLLVIRSADIGIAVEFCKTLGLSFTRESHGRGPDHFACTMDDCTLEIYPLSLNQSPTTTVRLGFQVNSVDETVASLQANGIAIVSEPSNSAWGRRAVVKDFDGHVVELLTSYI